MPQSGVVEVRVTMNNSIDSVTDDFIAAILATEVYATYAQELEKVKRQPELKAQIDDFRKRNHEMQMSADLDFNKLDKFEKEYEDFRADPMVADFLAAELDLCRMMQRINTRIAAGLNFE